MHWTGLAAENASFKNINYDIDSNVQFGGSLG